MSDAHMQFFGDAEHPFKLTIPLIPELEKVTAVGVGALCRRLFNGDFAHSDTIETIRLALIGAGAKPEDAHRLVTTYAPLTPYVELQALAVTILERLWFGAPATKPATVEAAP